MSEVIALPHPASFITTDSLFVVVFHPPNGSYKVHERLGEEWNTEASFEGGVGECLAYIGSRYSD